MLQWLPIKKKVSHWYALTDLFKWKLVLMEDPAGRLDITNWNKICQVSVTGVLPCRKKVSKSVCVVLNQVIICIRVWRDTKGMKHPMHLWWCLYLVFTCMAVESYNKQLQYLLLCLYYIFLALINSLVCWCNKTESFLQIKLFHIWDIHSVTNRI